MNTLLDDPVTSAAEAVVAFIDNTNAKLNWTPDSELLQKIGALLVSQKRIAMLEDQAKASAAEYREQVKSEMVVCKNLTLDIDERTWVVESYDEEAGLAHRRNMLTGEVETRPYEPAAQTELQFDKPMSPTGGVLGNEDDVGDYARTPIERSVAGDRLLRAADQEGKTPKQLASEIGLSPTTVKDMCRLFVDKGLFCSTATKGTYAITSKGQDAIEEL